jgi:hypothetical protein
MKFLSTIAMAAVMEAGACADPVTAYVEDLSVVPSPVLSRAEVLANEIFGGAGVKINWRRGELPRSPTPRERAIVVEMATDTPKQRTPGALAYALPYEGVHITVFYDRLKEAAAFEPTANALLAHVLVHEITHLIEGSDRHSDTGIMKARWTIKDIRDMRWKTLSFDAADLQLIRTGLARRANAGTLTAATKTR